MWWLAGLGLHWPQFHDLGPRGISFIELLILYERCSGGRRPISVSAAFVGLHGDIWKLCQHLAGMMKALRFLPGGIGRFIPWRIGANDGRFWAYWLGKSVGMVLPVHHASLLVNAFWKEEV